MKGVLRVYLAVSEARPHPALQAVRAAARPLPAASHRTCKYLRAARLSGSGKVSQNRSMFGHEETWGGTRLAKMDQTEGIEKSSPSTSERRQKKECGADPGVCPQTSSGQG